MNNPKVDVPKEWIEGFNLNIMNISQQELKEIQNTAIRKYVLDLLMAFHKNSLEGKGFDFFFVLSTDLDDLNKNIKSAESFLKQ